MFQSIALFLLFVVGSLACRSIERPLSSVQSLLDQNRREWEGPVDKTIAQHLAGASKVPCQGGVLKCSNGGVPVTWKVIQWRHPQTNFLVQGNACFVNAMSKAMTEIYQKFPHHMQNMRRLGDTGCRPTKNGSKCGPGMSVHSYGAATDLAPRGNGDYQYDNCVLNDWVDMFPSFHKYGIFWGAGFRRSNGSPMEDGHHWELSNRLAKQCRDQGNPHVPGPVVTPGPAPDRCKGRFGSSAACMHVSQCKGTTTRGFCPGDANNLCCHGAPLPPAQTKCVMVYGPKAVCQDVKLCKTRTVVHHCPGGVDNRCCLPPPPAPAPTPKPTPQPTPKPIPTCVKTFGARASCVATASCKGVPKQGHCQGLAGKVCCTPDLCAEALGGASKCIASSAKCSGTVVSGYCATGTKCCGPLQDTPAIGALEGTLDSIVTGWACDKDSAGKAIDVHIYEGGRAGSNGAAVTSLRQSCPKCLGKNAPASVDWKACGCSGAGSKCKVGFAIPARQLHGILEHGAGASVKLYAYAINEGPDGSKNIALSNNGLAVVLPPEPPAVPCYELSSYGCPACVAANDGTTCVYCAASFACVDASAKADCGGSALNSKEQCEAEQARLDAAEQAALDVPPTVNVPPVDPACFAPLACDSSLPCCDLCTPLVAGSPCADASPDGCKAAAVCNGVDGHCPSRERLAVGSTCDDGNPCTTDDKCTLDGTCFGTHRGHSAECGCESDAQCNDGHECTMDRCDTATGLCVHDAHMSLKGRQCRRVTDRDGCDLEEFCTGLDTECPADDDRCSPNEMDDEIVRGDEFPALEIRTNSPSTIGGHSVRPFGLLMALATIILLIQ